MLAALLSACTVSNVASLNGKTYPPTTFVEVLTEKPSRPYEQFALVETQGSLSQPMSDMIDGLRKKAMEVGADAVILAQDASYTMGATYINTGTVYTPIPGGRYPVLRGIAIKYK